MRARPTPRAVAERWLARLAAERPGLPEWWHAGKVIEEAGEAWRAYLRLTGLARQRGSAEELAEELADTVISAYGLALVLGLDLDAAVADKAAELLTRKLGELGVDWPARG